MSIEVHYAGSGLSFLGEADFPRGDTVFTILNRFCAAAAAEPAPPGPPAQGVHYLYLIRHGMYDRDERVTDDRVGNGLNALGREQARILGARLAALPIKIHALDASDFKRARETAEELGAALKLKPVLDPLLHECTPTVTSSTTPASAQDAASCDAQLGRALGEVRDADPGGRYVRCARCPWQRDPVADDARAWGRSASLGRA